MHTQSQAGTRRRTMGLAVGSIWLVAISAVFGIWALVQIDTSLASRFRVPRYHVMAFFFCAIPAATLMLLPESSLVGHAQSWYVLPSLGCGAVAVMTAIAGLKEAWDSTSNTVTVLAR